MAKKIGSVGRNDILFYFEILVFDKDSTDTTVDPLAVTMLVLSTSKSQFILWKISVTIMVHMYYGRR
jgi:hypothetical protein